MDRAEIEHEPVLCEAVLSLTAAQAGEVVVDATLGHGGHASLLAALLGPRGRLIGLDVDIRNLERARTRIESAIPESDRPRLDLIQANFTRLDDVLDELRVSAADVILADLGLSTDQMLDTSRGLTFTEDGPLDMRLDESLETTAADLVNRLGETELADLIYEYSQERLSRKIAKRICLARRRGRIRRTSELVQIICAAMGAAGRSHHGKIHPATRTFLALRIAVNHELDNLTTLLSLAPERLAEGGRFAVISFHSGEDRLVKKDFLDRSRKGVYEIRTKKPIQASREEIRKNSRSRSAKLRVAMRTGQTGFGT